MQWLESIEKTFFCAIPDCHRLQGRSVGLVDSLMWNSSISSSGCFMGANALKKAPMVFLQQSFTGHGMTG